MSEKKVSASSRNLKLLHEYNKEANRITQESIETALLLLMEEKDFASISITEITSRAGVSRTAYYRNYSSKEDVLRNLFNRVEDSIMDKIREFLSQDTFHAYLELFQAFAQESQSFRIIHKAGLSWDYLMEMNRRFTADLPDGNNAQRYQKYFWMGALSNVVFMWMEGGMKESPEEMDLHFLPPLNMYKSGSPSGEPLLFWCSRRERWKTEQHRHSVYRIYYLI